VIKSNVVGISYGVDAAAWDRQVTGKLRDLVGSAESAAFGLCAKMALQVAELNDDKISIVFDQGRRSSILQIIYDGACRLIPEAAKNAAATFMPVISTPGLQAADLVANYFYTFAREYLRDTDCKPDPHLVSFLTNTHVVDGMMGEPEIVDMVKEMRSKNAWLRDD
jgi:hypothetical protein